MIVELLLDGPVIPRWLDPFFSPDTLQSVYDLDFINLTDHQLHLIVRKTSLVKYLHVALTNLIVICLV